MAEHELLARPHDSALRWIVTSRTRPEIEHLVDLEGFGGIGRCSCEHFEFRIAPDLREGRRRVGGSRCSHILVARNTFTDAMIQTLLGHRRENPGTCEHCGDPTDSGKICAGCQDEIDNETDEDN